MSLDDTIKRIKSDVAEIGSKMMTGRTIEEQIKEIILKNSNKNKSRNYKKNKEKLNEA